MATKSPLLSSDAVAALCGCDRLCVLLSLYRQRLGTATSLEPTRGVVRLLGLHRRIREDPAAREDTESGITLNEEALMLKNMFKVLGVRPPVDVWLNL